MLNSLISSQSIREMQIKIMISNDYTPIRTANIKTIKMPKAGQGVKWLFPLLVGMQNTRATLKKQIDSFLKTKHPFTIWPSNCSLGHLSQRSENLCLQKTLHMTVHRSFICNGPKLETTKCPIVGDGYNRLWDSPNMGYYSATKRNKLPIHATWVDF